MADDTCFDVVDLQAQDGGLDMTLAAGLGENRGGMRASDG